MDIRDDLLLRADLDVLHGVQDILAKHWEKDEELAKALVKLEEFVAIHRTRTKDMITYRETINKARAEYSSLKLKYEGTKERLRHTKELLDKVIAKEVDETVDKKYDF